MVLTGTLHGVVFGDLSVVSCRFDLHDQEGVGMQLVSVLRVLKKEESIHCNFKIFIWGGYTITKPSPRPLYPFK